MFGKAKRIKKLEQENEDLKKQNEDLKKQNEDLKKQNEDLKRQVASFDVLTQQLASAFERANPAACLKEANNAYANFLQFHANEAERGREHPTRVYEDLRKRLDDARDRVDALYQFLIVAGHRIGVFEGLLRNRGNASILRGDLKALVDSWTVYQSKLLS